MHSFFKWHKLLICLWPESVFYEFFLISDQQVAVFDFSLTKQQKSNCKTLDGIGQDIAPKGIVTHIRLRWKFKVWDVKKKKLDEDGK